MKILIDHHAIRTIPALEFYNPEASEKLPVIILMHGFSGRKEHCFTHAYQLAQQGYFAVSVDLHLHGESSDGEFSAAQVTPRIIEVVERSIHNIEVLVNEYAHHAIADGRRIGLLGISLGGVVIYHYLQKRQPEIRAAVVNIAGALPFWPITLRKIMQHYPEFGVSEALIVRMEQELRSEVFLDCVADFPLLMQYGQEDPIVPIEEVRRLYQTVQRQYTHPELIKLIEYPQTSHETPPAMFERGMDWFEEYLKV